MRPVGQLKMKSGIEALPRHRVVSCARRVVHGEHDLRNVRRGHRLDEARARANDSLVLGLGSDHEARDVLHEQQRNPLAVAAVDEERDFLRALGVDDAAEPRLLARAALDQAALIGDHADRHAHDVARRRRSSRARGAT